jgi:hypothetical protein
LHEKPEEGTDGIHVVRKSTKNVSAIQPGRPILKAVREAAPALAASAMPLRSERPHTGAMTKYWKAMPGMIAEMSSPAYPAVSGKPARTAPGKTENPVVLLI